MDRSVVIVGAGVAGLCAGVRLTEAGFDVTIFEKSSRVGGVRNDNSYPGAACDIASVLYSFSFNVTPRWTRPCARQDEIQAYLADKVVGHLDAYQRSANWVLPKDDEPYLSSFETSR